MILDILRSLGQLPIPQILILAGIAFVFFAFFEVKPVKKPPKPLVPALVGATLFFLGMALWAINVMAVDEPDSSVARSTPTLTYLPASDTPSPVPGTSLPPPTMSESAVTSELTTPQPIRTISSLSEAVWTLGTYSGIGERVLEGDHLEIAVVGPDAMLGSLLDDVWFADFVASVDAQAMTTCPGGYGFLFRFVSNDSWYRATIGTDRIGNILLDLDESFSSLSEWELPYGFDIYGVHRLTLAVVGNEIAFYVDGNGTEIIRDSNISRGSFGLVARTGSSCGFTARFTNFSLKIYNY